MEAAGTPEVTSTHPIRLVVNDDLQRTRLTVFFRLILAIPLLLWAVLWAVIAVLAYIVNWFATLFMGQSPDGLHNFLATFLRYTTHVRAYTLLVADPYPSFTGREGTYPIDLEVDPPQRQNRWTVFFRGSSRSRRCCSRTSSRRSTSCWRSSAGSSRSSPAACPRACGTSPRLRYGSRRRPTRMRCC